MKPTELLGELTYPLTDMAIMLALVSFLLLGSLALAAGLLGLWLALVLTPAFFRYALYLLEARALGHEAPAPGIELFNWVENFWSLFPLVLLAGATWLLSFVSDAVSPAAAQLMAGMLFVLLPAPMGILALSRSAIESLNPAALKRLISACGPAYFYIPLVGLVGAAGVEYLRSIQAPGLVVNAAGIYVFFLFFTLTGAVMHSRQVAAMVDIYDQQEPDADALEQRLAEQRQQVANHAYGFISRGNRAGGFRHIGQWLEREADIGEAREWFFREMLSWENTDAALFFAQDYLHELLVEQQDTVAIKLIARCLHENPAFRPSEEDSGAVQELLEIRGRNDLIEIMR